MIFPPPLISFSSPSHLLSFPHSLCRAKPWRLGIPVDMVFPCATQNELDLEDAKALVQAGAKYVLEGESLGGGVKGGLTSKHELQRVRAAGFPAAMCFIVPGAYPGGYR